MIRSDGTFVRDYFYVEDGAAAYMLLAEAPGGATRRWPGEAFNFSNELQVTVLDLVRQILRLMGSDLEPDVRNEASNEIRHQYLSAAKARRRARLGAAVRPRRRACAGRSPGIKEFLCPMAERVDPPSAIANCGAPRHASSSPMVTGDASARSWSWSASTTPGLPREAVRAGPVAGARAPAASSTTEEVVAPGRRRRSTSG